MLRISQLVILISIFFVCLVTSTIIYNHNMIIDQYIKEHKNVSYNTPATRSSTKSELDITFDQFKKAFGKSYQNSIEESIKKSNFNLNKVNLQKSNCHPCGVNSLFDRSPSELTGLLGQLPGKWNPPSPDQSIIEIQESTSTGLGAGVRLLQTAPLSFDWRTYNVVTPVKDQGQCGSCWTFSAASFLESEYLRRGGSIKDIDLAEQYLLKCQTTSSGCNGGYVFTAVSKGLKGMPQDYRYPYLGTSNYTTTMCKKPTLDVFFLNSGTVLSWAKTTKASDAQIISNLLQRPLIMAVNANDMLKYAPTVDNKILSCDPTNSDGTVINHAVLLVGYTETAWLIKNSWGTTWGDQGYVWVTRDPTKSCNIGNYWGTVNSTLTPVV